MLKRPSTREGRRRLVELRAILKIRSTRKSERIEAERELAELLTPKDLLGEGTAPKDGKAA